MKIGLEVSHMHKLSQSRGIGTYSQNLFESIKKFTDAEIELIPNKTDYNNFDLIHFPFFDLFKRSLPLRIPKPFVVTIPDLIPLQFPNHYPVGLKGKANFWFQKLAINQAKGVIAISDTVKSDISKILKIDSKKIFTTYLAPSEDYQKISDTRLLKDIKDKYTLPDDFVLYVGNVNWNKNILNMTEACIRANKNLVIIGNAFLDETNLNHPEKKSQKIFLEKYKDNKLIKILGFVEKEDLVVIMNLATILIFVSFYEGFGLPILEAQASNLPVITSNLSATAEVAGKGALLVNPEDPLEISESIKKVYDSESLRKKLIDEGQVNLKRFSWEKTAKETVEVYKKCI